MNEILSKSVIKGGKIYIPEDTCIEQLNGEIEKNGGMLIDGDARWIYVTKDNERLEVVVPDK